MAHILYDSPWSLNIHSISNLFSMCSIAQQEQLIFRRVKDREQNIKFKEELTSVALSYLISTFFCSLVFVWIYFDSVLLGNSSED